MLSKLHRGGAVPLQPVAWPRVAPLDPQPAGEAAYPAATYAPLGGSQAVGRAQGGDDGQPAYHKGFQDGQAAARREGTAQAEGMNLQLARTIEELTGLRRRFRHEAEEEVVALAIAIARRILHRELTVAPEALLGLVKAALEKMDAREVQRVRVARSDAAMVSQQLDKMGLPRPIEVIAEPNLPRGSVIFDSSRGALDASAETQLAEIERGFADLVRRA